MDITTRDVVSLLGLLGMGAGVYVAIVQRVTRMEALVHRVEQVEDDVADLQRKGGELGEALATLTSDLRHASMRIGALESTVSSGIAQVLEELRKRVPGDRRRVDES